MRKKKQNFLVFCKKKQEIKYGLGSCFFIPSSPERKKKNTKKGLFFPKPYFSRPKIVFLQKHFWSWKIGFGEKVTLWALHGFEVSPTKSCPPPYTRPPRINNANWGTPHSPSLICINLLFFFPPDVNKRFFIIAFPF